MIAKVQLWGRTIGAVSLAEGREVAAFQYAPEFAASGIELSPLVMPLSERVYEFPALPRNTFYGLPGLLADSLPDKFGNALIDAWLATQGRTAGSFSAVERVCYTGARGMGALEFSPALGPKPRKATKISVDSLVRLAGEVLTHRGDLQGHFHDGFDYWLLKFDGVAGNKDKELEDPKGYGAIEFAYHLMAKTAGITVTECRLLEENGRRHFMTRRFDRLAGGEKLHMQSLCALAHFDFNQTGAYAYEQALLAIRQLKLSMASVEEQFRRMVFNIVARNQDDHVKNIAFLMNKQGEWSLAPAFDVTYSYNPSGSWTATHQMTLNAKRDEFTLEDFEACAKAALMKRGRAATIIEEVRAAVKRWPEFAAAAKLPDEWGDKIQQTHRLNFPKT